ncbi:PAS domain-containing protein [Roseomonas sp. HJA6]|uniref:histidine kinase n=1 Tax=Roseomonas alba TaxID=2846776 RepID=A0ABS7AGQ4_9PROT|nr:HWE histidine kinase domain-containing protein [Neoroseomonas alba]MBW6401489.1 PAS domain-containing protein [Neoroseomonas alba]
MDEVAPLRLAGFPGVAAPVRRRNARRLWMLFAAVVLLPTAILVTGAWGAWHLTWTETEHDLTRGADLNAAYVQRNLENLIQASERMADTLMALDRPATPSEKARLDEGFALLNGGQRLLHAVLVLDAAGRELRRVDAQPGSPVGAPGGDFRQALADVAPGTLAVGTVYRQDGGLLIACGRRRPASDHAVVMLIDTAQLGLALGRHTDSATDTAALMRQDGQILARQPPLIDPLPPVPPERPLRRALATGLRQGTVTGQAVRDDHPVALAYRRLDSVPGLVVTVGRRHAEIVQHWRQVLVPLLMVGFPAVVALVGLALVVRRQQEALEGALDGLEQRVAERTASLREGEERLRLAVEAGRFGTWETDLSTGLTTRSARALEIAGLGPDLAVSPFDDWIARIHPGDRERFRAVWDRILGGQSATYREEYRLQRVDGGSCWIEAHGAVVRADPETGHPLRVAGTVQDITERREAEERRELLTQEVNHRARNTLAIIQAILRLTRADSAEGYARLIEGRVAALARAQTLLAAERWTGAPLAAMLIDELAPFGGVGIGHKGPDCRFVIAGPAFRIRAEAVQALGMVFHELATNAVKHGALSTPDGEVVATWRIDEVEGLLRMRWQESGGRPPGLPVHRGVGSRVIEATVAGQLGGSVDRRWPDEGMVCDILLPLAQVRTDRP